MEPREKIKRFYEPGPNLKFATGVQKGRPLDSANVPYRIIERDGLPAALFNTGAMARFYRDGDVCDTCGLKSEAAKLNASGECTHASIDGWTYMNVLPKMACIVEETNQQIHEELPKVIGRILDPERPRTCDFPSGAMSTQPGTGKFVFHPNEPEEDYPGQTFFHKHNANIKRTEEAFVEEKMKPREYVRTPIQKKTIAAFRGPHGRRPTHPCDPAYGIFEDGVQQSYVDVRTVGHGLREYLWLYELLRSFGRGRFHALWEAWEIYHL